jgi:hypothetical protein
MILKITQDEITQTVQRTIGRCKPLSKSERADLLHSCTEKTTTATGSEQVAVKIIQSVLTYLIQEAQ